MRRNVKEFILINIGMLMVAIGLYFFLMPANLATGGANGLALVLNHVIPFLSVGVLMIIINIVLFVIAFLIIGTSFGIKTIYASLGTSLLVLLFEKVIPINEPLVEDIILQLTFGIFISAIGMGIVFNQNASTGGTDIIAKILNKFWGIEIGRAVLFSDFAITLGAAFAFGPELGMYSLLGVILNGLVIDTTIEGINLSKQVNIVSDQNDDIKEYIVTNLKRGATLYYAEGAYTGDKKNVIVAVLDRKDFIKLKNYICCVDKNAFITVSNVYEVLGDGFKTIEH
ncbi:YitT family protein [Anaerosalibacter sp. Marseille-P3206]|uniref:YitT family protein n=1 Tax=Anaerosalibacter sp. Marseille-P3206 TaxID=1871005 RepID=UPI000BE94682|nr:YitT family protein [Anaerosalibacter sp. Marseille-P3206]